MSVTDSLLNAPLPNLLIVLGAFFFLLAIVSEITDTPLGSLTADGYGRAIAFAIGPLFLALGVVVLLVTTPVVPAAGPNTEQTSASGAVGTLTPSGMDTTPPERLTPLDHTLTRTPQEETPTTSTSGRLLLEREPNDDAFNADVIGVGDSISGEVRSTYSADPWLDSDYFAVWVEAGDPVTVDVIRDGGVGTLYVVVLDPNGLPEPSGDWLLDTMLVQSGGRVQVDTVASQTGYHYVYVGGFVYLDQYYTDGGNGGYTVEIRSDRSASLDGPAVESVDELTPPMTGDAGRATDRAVV